MTTFKGNLVFLATLAVFLPSPALSQNLTAVLTSTKLATGLHFTAISYNHAESIYLFGGLTHNFDASDAIFHYNLTSEELSVVAHFPIPIYGGTVQNDGHGNYFYFGGNLIPFDGEPSRYSLAIYKFNSNSGEVSQVGTILRYMFDSASIVYNNTIVIFGSSYYSEPVVYSFDMESHRIRQLANMPERYMEHAAVWDEVHQRALIFGYKYRTSRQNDVIPKAMESFTFYKPTGFEDNEVIQVNLPVTFSCLTRSVITLGRYAYVIGAQRPSTSNYIVRVELETLDIELLLVNDFIPWEDINDVDIFYNVAAVHVERLQRVYYFGGRLQLYSDNSGIILDNIAYIDLSPLDK